MCCAVSCSAYRLSDVLFLKDPQKSVNTKLMLDRVSDENCEEADLLTKHFAKLTLDAPGYTPWFDTWMKLYLQTLPVVEHEFLRHSLGVIFVVSTNSKQPVEAFRQLSGRNYFLLVLNQLIVTVSSLSQPAETPTRQE